MILLLHRKSICCLPTFLFPSLLKHKWFFAYTDNFEMSYVHFMATSLASGNIEPCQNIKQLLFQKTNDRYWVLFKKIIHVCW